MQPIAKEMGYNFSTAELLNYEKEMVKKITEQQLEAVSGGVDIKSLALGGIVSLLALGAGIVASTGSASAQLDTKAITSSSESMETEITKKIELPKVLPDQEKKETKKINPIETQTQQKGGSSSEETSEFKKTTVNQATIEAKKEHQTQGEVTDLETAQVAKSVDPAKAPEYLQLTEKQKLYVYEALNLQEAYALLQSGVIENLRFYGNVLEIETKEGIRRYTADRGDPFIELLFMLFPSNAGTLNIASSGDRLTFSKFGGISPEIMAKFCAILNDYRNGKITSIPQTCKSIFDNKDKPTNEFNQIVEWLKNKKIDLALQIENYLNEYLSGYERIDSELKNLNNQNAKLKKDLDKIYENNNTIQDIKTLLNVIVKIKKSEKSKNIKELERLESEKETLLKKLNVADNMSSIAKLKNDTRISIRENKKQEIEDIEKQIKENEKTIKEKRKEKETVKQLKDNILESTKKLNFYFSFVKTSIDAINLEINSNIENTYNLNVEFFTRTRKIEELEKEINSYTDGEITLNGTDEIIKEIKINIESLKNEIAELEKRKASLYPQYLTEHILMAYMIKTLNTKEDVEKLYQEIAKQLSQNEANKLALTADTTQKIKENIENEKNNIELLNEIISASNFVELSPYKTDPQQNDNTYKISPPNEEGKVQIINNTFADCADITARHIINLLTYSNNKNWDMLLNGANIDGLNSKLTEVVDAIKNKGQVQFYDLKTRLQMFFLYQSEKGADDVTSLTRTLWEYAICNMDENNLAKGADNDKGFYPIQYVGGKNFELETGYENMLKLMWNIASALNLGGDIIHGKTKLDLSKENIDKIVSENNYNANLFESAIKSTFELFHPNVNEITISSTGISDYYGKVNVEIKKDDNNLSFQINQDKGHAYINHNSVNFVGNDKFNEEKYKNDFGKLLLRRFTKGLVYNIYYNNIPKSTGFYGTFSGESLESDDAFKQTDLYKKYKALSVFRDLQGEEGNEGRILHLINCEVMDNAKQIKLKSSNYTLADVFLEKYICSNLSLFDESFQNSIQEYIESNSLYTVYDENNNAINYLKLLKLNKNEVKLLLINEENIGSELKIPSKIYDKDKRELKVTEVFRLTDDELPINNLIFEGDFESLTITAESYFILKEPSLVLNFTGHVENLTIGKNVFSHNKFKNFSILGDVKNLKIENEAFGCCGSLETFIIPDSVETLNIGDKAFCDCKTLNTFIIPDSVVTLSINENAFYNNFINLWIPNKLSVKNLQKNVTLLYYEIKDKNLELKIEGQSSDLSLDQRELEYITKAVGFNDISEIENLNVKNDVTLCNINLFASEDFKTLFSEKIKTPNQINFISAEKFEYISQEEKNGCLYLKTTNENIHNLDLRKNNLRFLESTKDIVDYSDIKFISATNSKGEIVKIHFSGITGINDFNSQPSSNENHHLNVSPYFSQSFFNENDIFDIN